MKSLDDAIKRHYLSKSLREEVLGGLMGGSNRPQLRASRRVRISRRVGVIAGVVAIVVAVVAVSFRSSRDFTQRLAVEVAVSHNKHLPLDVESPHYEVVQAGLSGVDFPVIPARRELLTSYELVGGRHCSLDGAQAVQLRLRERASGEFTTLYVTRLDGKSRWVRQVMMFRHGVCVELWVENGLVYAFACEDRRVGVTRRSGLL